MAVSFIGGGNQGTRRKPQTITYTVKPVYKGHSREPKNVPFIYRLKLYALYINEENEAALYRQWFVI
jgi:hypothetical protein